MNFVRFLMEKDKEKQLSEYIWNGINTFYKIYENETKDVMSQKSKSKKSEPPKERRKKRIKSYKKPSPVPTKNA